MRKRAKEGETMASENWTEADIVSRGDANAQISVLALCYSLRHPPVALAPLVGRACRGSCKTPRPLLIGFYNSLSRRCAHHLSKLWYGKGSASNAPTQISSACRTSLKRCTLKSSAWRVVASSKYGRKPVDLVSRGILLPSCRKAAVYTALHFACCDPHLLLI